MNEKQERLQKVIAHSGVTSRRKAEDMIVDGQVKVNGEVVTELGTKVSERDKVEVNGIPLEKERKVYFLFNKPRGVISSVDDDKDRQVVTDYFKHIPERIYPVGRLDYDSSGIILLTNDGEFAHLLMHPKHEISKVYVAKIKGIPNHEQLKDLRRGVRSENEVLKASRYKLLSVDRRKNTSIIELQLREGKNRHIRRMMESLGFPVSKLRREKYGFLQLHKLPAGEYRELSHKEVHDLKESALR